MIQHQRNKNFNSADEKPFWTGLQFWRTSCQRHLAVNWRRRHSQNLNFPATKFSNASFAMTTSPLSMGSRGMWIITFLTIMKQTNDTNSLWVHFRVELAIHASELRNIYWNDRRFGIFTVFKNTDLPIFKKFLLFIQSSYTFTFAVFMNIIRCTNFDLFVQRRRTFLLRAAAYLQRPNLFQTPERKRSRQRRSASDHVWQQFARQRRHKERLSDDVFKVNDLHNCLSRPPQIPPPA